MGITKHLFRGIKRFFVARDSVFEISGDSGSVNSYAIRIARGEGGKADPVLAEMLARRAERLERQRQRVRELQSEGQL